MSNLCLKCRFFVSGLNYNLNTNIPIINLIVTAFENENSRYVINFL